jgi:adenylosuccinate lyase
VLMAFNKLTEVRKALRYRGIKGATGTQDSFLTLFNGDEEKVEALDDLVTHKAGFTKRFFIAGQTYSRQQDSYIIFALSNLGSAVTKVCNDIRILQAMEELLEPFEADQIGSSAMPYKRNPMKCERICGIARDLISAVQQPLNTLAVQGLERTLDDSANRRMLIPDAFLCAEAVLTTFQNVFEGLSVQTENVERTVRRELPFLALEKALMKLTEYGVSRQDAHSKIRDTALKAKEMQKTQEVTIEQMLSDPFFDKVRDEVVALANDPLKFTGRCRSQVDRFLKKELQPAIQEYLDEKSHQRISLDV